MKIKFTQTLSIENPVFQVIGTAQLIEGRLVCTGKAERYMDILLHGNRDLDAVKRALLKAVVVFNTLTVKAEVI